MALGLSTGVVNCLVRRRRLLASGIPVWLNASRSPLETRPTLSWREAWAGGRRWCQDGAGRTGLSARERVAVRLSAEAEADALEISPERNVLDLVHFGETADGRVVEG